MDDQVKLVALYRVQSEDESLASTQNAGNPDERLTCNSYWD